jgi:ubiquinone biosynthesis protein
MRDIAKILTLYNDVLENLNLSLIVESFAMTLQEEMSFVIERHHIERFSKNFKGNKLIKVPRVYADLSSDRVLCMEYLDGFKVTDAAEIKRRGMDVQTLVKNGINLYLEQVIIHGFFHGDPHPGNMMVMPDGRIAFLDFGNMGKLLGIDRRQLEEFIQSAISEDAVRLADVIEDVAVVSHIPDRNQFERSLYEIFDMIDNVSLGDLSLDLLFNRLWKIIGDNRLYFPEYIYQLMRGISLMEGIGRQLYPDLNIMESIKPFARRIMMERLSPEAIFKKGKHKVESFARDVEKLPEDMRALVRLFRTGNFTLNHRLISARSFNTILRKGVNRIVIGIMFMSLNLLGGMIIVARVQPQWWGIPIFAWICLGSAWIFAVYLFIAMIRAKDND